MAEAIRKFAESHGYEPQLIFLENHGVFVGSISTEEIESIYAELMSTIEAKLRRQLPGTVRSDLKSVIIDRLAELHPGFAGFSAIGFRSEPTDWFLASEESFSKANKSFTPDDIVYCKAHYLYIPAGKNDAELFAITSEKIADYFAKYGYLPKLIAVRQQGVFGIEESLKSASNVLDVYENILKISFYAENFGGPKFMNDEQIAFIDNWEVENYRRKIGKS